MATSAARAASSQVPTGRPVEAALQAVAERPETSSPAGTRERNLDRERLYADIGGAIIGLSGAAALINFVLLR